MKTYTRIKYALVITFLTFCACNLSAQASTYRQPSYTHIFKTNVYMLLNASGEIVYDEEFAAEIRIDGLNSYVVIRDIKGEVITMYKYTRNYKDGEFVVYTLVNGGKFSRKEDNSMAGIKHADGETEIYVNYKP